jgi:hypothetical protein
MPKAGGSGMTLREAVRLFARPWIDGNVTVKEWLLACTVLQEAINLEPLEGGTVTSNVSDVAREFIAYYQRGGGCSNCGGLPHSETCFVGRFIAALESAGSTTRGHASDKRKAIGSATDPSVLRYSVEALIVRVVQRVAEFVGRRGQGAR